MRARSKLDFLRKYLNHLWRCYKTVSEVRTRLDKMMFKLYTL